MVAKFLDHNKPKRHLKSGYALFQTSSILFDFIVGETEKTVSKFRKRKFCEIRTFHVAVVQQRLRNALRSVMNVQSCSFASLNLLLFCCSPSPLHKLSTERFQMTSGRPYQCSKTIKGRPCWCCKPILWELELFSYVNSFFCSHKFAQMLVT